MSVGSLGKRLPLMPATTTMPGPTLVKGPSTVAPVVHDNPSMGAVVLIIDDSTTLRNQIKQTLQSTNEFDRFLEADNGLTWFKLMIEHQPDVVICDLVMPV